MKLGISLGVSRLGQSSPSGPSSSVTFVSSASTGAGGIWTPTGTAVGDWLFIATPASAGGPPTGGSGGVWASSALLNGGGDRSVLYYRQLTAGDIGAAITTPQDSFQSANWVVYRGVASVSLLQTPTTAAGVNTISFTAPTLSPLSSRLLAMVHKRGPTFGSLLWNAPAGWTTRESINTYGPKYAGDIQSSAYPGGSIDFSTSAAADNGNVGWLLELIGT